MMDAKEIVLETFSGPERKRLLFTRAQYDKWLENIRADGFLVAKIKAVMTGAEPMRDLDEGDAGVFKERLFPYTDEITDKLEISDERDRHLVVASLLHRVLREISSKD